MDYTFKICIISIFLVSIFTTTTIYADENYSIPTWIKTNAEWWSNNQIDDKTFATAIEFFQKAKETLNIAEPFSKDNDLIDNMLHDLDQLHKHTEKMQRNIEETKNSQ